MQTRLVEYFLALHRERHFGRAAAACHVSQPTLSAGIATLEGQLGKRLIVRDRKYAGLTPEGEAILPWAQQIVAATEALGQAAGTARGPLKGELRLGAIPASMPATGILVEAIRSHAAELNVQLRALTSRQIERDLAAFELDAGVTYLDFESPAHALSIPLYTERSILVSARDGITVPETPEWPDLAGLPLCLLHQGMQNRRILDARVAAFGLALRPTVTADSYIALLAIIRQGHLCTVMPDSHITLLEGLSWARLTPLPETSEPNRIGIIVSDRAPMSPLAQTVLAVARSLRLPAPYRPA
ncbi:LysR family transcriptional regulator [Sphingopyxis flava]|uniref:DNA-binding transcriptional regulator, LysR family n=1 Tax=Sphingopyxis flava TaxID=1507287 RepID=A0A1T5G5B0_9SPHN|nr:LysR family transcriptional regulator [Sphingopyxis flava]SKC03630.1 DNA-binding transcriptional regulator, LysR family [Sphingopyxis flava]